jgi:hypothetical protein
VDQDDGRNVSALFRKDLADEKPDARFARDQRIVPDDRQRGARRRDGHAEEERLNDGADHLEGSV